MKSSKYIREINRCIKKGNLSLVSGGYMEQFENEASKLFGNKYGVSTCNGTSALFLALYSLSLNNNKKEVIIPAYGFHVSVSLVCSLKLKPVFCDIDLDTFTIDFDECERLINKNTLAVIVLEPWGNLANLDKMNKLKKKYKVFFISDSSHAHETKWNNKPIGQFFDINCASFGLGKLISGGELGILTTDNHLFRDRALLYSHTNRVPGDLITSKYKEINNNVGIKFRPHLFALLLALRDLKSNKSARNQIKKNILKFQNDISKITNKIHFQKAYSKADRVFYMPIIAFNTDMNIDSLLKELMKKGFRAQGHNYTKPLNRISILTDFYHIKIKKRLLNTETIINTHIIQLYASDFINNNKVAELKSFLLSYVNRSNE